MPQMQWLRPNGFVPDLIQSQVDLEHWTIGSDMVFRGQPERITGVTSVYGTPLFAPQWVLATRTNADAPAWLYAGTAGLGESSGGTHTNVTPAAGWAPLALPNPFTGGVLNGVPVLGSGTFFYWPGAGAALPLPGWPVGAQAFAMRPYFNHLVALGIINADGVLGDAVWWSSAAEPGLIPDSWAPAPDNEAGSAAVAQTGGSIVDGAPLRDAFIIYKDSSTYVMEYVGGSLVMSIRLLYPATGLLARNCVAPHRGLHYLLSDGDVLVNDGQNVTSIAERRVRRAIFDRIDGDNFQRSFAVADEARGEVWFCVPEQGNAWPNVAWVYNVGAGEWGRRELPEKPAHIGIGQVRFTTGPITWSQHTEFWAVSTGVWQASSGRAQPNALLEASPTTSKLYAVDIESTRDGAGIGGLLRRDYMDLGDAGAVKTISRIWISASGSPGQRLRVSVAATQTLTETPLLIPAGDFRIGIDRKVDIFATGAYITLQLEGVVDGVPYLPWRLGSVGIEWNERGRF